VKGGEFVLVFVNNESEDVLLVRKFKKIVLYIVNFFAIEKAKKSAKNGTGSGGGYKDLTFMGDGNGARGVEGEVVGNVVKVEIGGCGWRRCGGRKGGDRNKVRSGEVSKGVVEEVDDVGVTGSEEGVGEDNVGIAPMELARKGLAIEFTDIFDSK
jgi:hypothetical protein